MSDDATLAMPDGWDPLPGFMVRRGLLTVADMQPIIDELGDRAHGKVLLNRLEQAGYIDGMQHKALYYVAGGSDIFGDYVTIREIGQGASGTVFVGMHLDTGQEVAIKVLRHEFAENEQVMQRFHREVELLTQIKHPHIAGAYGHGVSNGKPWMAIELINGPSLEVMVKEIGALPEPYVLRVIMQVVKGLAHVYKELGLIHRDLKPGNIIAAREPEAEGANRNLYTDRDIAKIIDFGLAKCTESDATLTATGMTMGTPAYMSPEQIQASVEIDCRADIYSLGATMYHLLTGQTPFSGPSAMMVMTAHMTEPVPDPTRLVPSLHPFTVRLVTTSMNKKADQRFPSYDHFLQACQQAMDAIGVSTKDDMRLLRKPMVIKRPDTSRKARRRNATETGASASGPAMLPELQEGPTESATKQRHRTNGDEAQTTDRILRKYREKKQESSHGVPPAARSQGTDYSATLPEGAEALPALEQVGALPTAPAGSPPMAPVTGHDGYLPTDSDHGAQPAAANATDALRVASTDRIRRRQQPTTDQLASHLIPDGPLGTAGTASADDDEHFNGLGILPWAVLIGAIGLAIAIYLLFGGRV